MHGHRHRRHKNAPVIQNPYSSSSTSMRWSIIQITPGKYKFVNKQSGKVMDIVGGHVGDGTELIQYRYTGSANQQWTFNRTASGYYKFSPGTNAASGLDVHGASTSPGAAVVEWTYNGSASQEWTVAPAN